LIGFEVPANPLEATFFDGDDYTELAAAVGGSTTNKRLPDPRLLPLGGRALRLRRRPGPRAD
jgi:hypothetical protein